MTDNITLPRAVVWRLHAAFRDADKTIRPSGEKSDYSAEIAALDAALAEPKKERAETGIPARGVGVGSGETDPSRGEAYPTPQPDAKREPATREQVAEAYKASESDGGEVIYCEAWRDAERFHGIRKEDKTSSGWRGRRASV
jgi:hypothetical protein